MKTTLFRKAMLLALTLVLSLCALPSLAQGEASDRKCLYGVWYMEWMKYDREQEVIHIKNTKYTRLKMFRPDGEYACVQMWMNKDGNVVIQPHEHGTFSYKKGVYSEMGRKLVPGKSEFNLTDDETINGRWYNTTDQLKKAKDLPKEVEQFLLDASKMHTTKKVDNANIEKAIKKHIFGVK